MSHYDVVSMKDLVKDLLRQQLHLFTGQLDHLIEKGLLVVETLEPVLVFDQEFQKVIITDQIRLHVKDKEYIEKLEKENKEMKDFIDALQTIPGIEQGFKDE